MAVDLWPGVLKDLESLITTVWPECATRVQAIYQEQVNWANVVGDGEETVPMAVVHFPSNPVPSDRWGASNVVQELGVVFYYFGANSGDAVATERNKASLMESKLLSLQPSSLPTGTIAVQKYTVSPGGDNNEPNRDFREAQMPYTAEQISFTVMFGKSAPAATYP